MKINLLKKLTKQHQNIASYNMMMLQKNIMKHMFHKFISKNKIFFISYYCFYVMLFFLKARVRHSVSQSVNSQDLFIAGI